MVFTLTQDLIAEPQPVGWVRAAVARIDSHSHDTHRDLYRRLRSLERNPDDE